MMKIDLDLKIKFLRAFGDKTRIQILECIRNGEKTVSQIVDYVEGNQSNISQHLACLKGCGIIARRQEGKYVYYRLRNHDIKNLLHSFDDILKQIQDEVANCDHHMN